MEKLEEERKQVEDWEARMGFTEEMRTTRQVRVDQGVEGVLLI